jgi:hypothetical protein
VLRVDPKVYFEEVAALRQGAIDGPQPKARATVDRARSSPRPVALGALGVAALLGAVWLLGARRAASPSGIALGGFGLVAVLGATALAARRRIRRYGLGSLERWTQVHVALGALGLLAALLHANFTLGGMVTGALLVVFGAVFLSGAFGQLLYKAVPPLLARIEGETSQLVEDVWSERAALETELAALTAAPALAELARAARGPAGGLLARLRKGYSPTAFASAAQADARLAQRLAHLPPERRADGRRVIADVARLADCRAQLLLYRLLRVWLALHISATALLLALLFTHVAAVVFWL